MSMHMQGTIKGRYIELPHLTGIPDGMPIVVDIHVVSPTFQEQHQLIDRLCGAWADDPSIPEIFSEIDEQRHRSYPRDITFDLPS